MTRFIQPNIFLYFFLLILGLSGFFFAVIWPYAIGFYAFIALSASGGFGVAFYIYYIKKHGRQLVCPVGSNCNAVINSRYSKFFGVPIEYGGMFYYATIFFVYVVLIFVPHLVSEFFLAGLIIFTAFAFLFSLYLLFAQAFLLRQWCIWCILSAVLSIVIFIISLASIDFAVTFLVEATSIIGAVHDFGFVLGVGGVTAALFLFFRFLRDLNIDEKELQTLKGISELVWLGLALVLVGQFVSYIAHAEALALSGPFLVQTIALFIVAISGAILMIIFAPFLAVIPFGNTAKNNRHSPLESLRKPVFIIGTIAVSSWYFAFIMNYLSAHELPALLLAYATTLVVSVSIAMFWEKIIGRNTPQNLR